MTLEEYCFRINVIKIKILEGGKVKFKIKRRKKFFPRLDKDAYRITEILSDKKGENNESRAFHIVENYLRVFIRKGFERKKRGENIEFSAVRCGNDKGRDIEITLLYPKDLRGEKIYLEIKSSKEGARRHRKRGRMQKIYRTEVIVVNKERSDKKIARSILAAIKREINRLRKKKRDS